MPGAGGDLPEENEWAAPEITDSECDNPVDVIREKITVCSINIEYSQHTHPKSPTEHFVRP